MKACRFPPTSAFHWQENSLLPSFPTRSGIQCLSFFMRGFAPARRGPFVSAKGPKTIGARAWPQGGTFAPVPIAWAAELASLRQSSPPNRIFGTAAQPRPKAPGGGAFFQVAIPSVMRNRQVSFCLSSSTFLIEDPVSLQSVFVAARSYRAVLFFEDPERARQ